ncbi:hypothetical protein GCM10007147_40310 [Nocardiopsis kunsanensis]|uniref:Peptidase M16 N-terminal domain-containing protein n=1 Tax=Nocardiopsis kunsanensis TaxID=141693 RepID=A0A919CKT1_9ACTN|nr:hypothetical protein GCM10007147_40310 [Nocardiopsis kunsanensis]
MPSINSRLLAADQEPTTTVTLLEPDHTVGRVQRTVLPSGLRVITEKKNAAAATVMFGVAVGSRDEEPQEYGAAHFLEHLASCGTETRSKDDILAEGERIGARSNAGTGAEHTTYFATVLPRDVPAALDLIGDMVTRPRFTSAGSSCRRSPAGTTTWPSPSGARSCQACTGLPLRTGTSSAAAARAWNSSRSPTSNGSTNPSTYRSARWWS